MDTARAQGLPLYKACPESISSEQAMILPCAFTVSALFLLNHSSNVGVLFLVLYFLRRDSDTGLS